LATEKTNREEIASIFVKYGNILEISLKGSYGFVQFDNHVSCENAINSENRRLVGDLKLGLCIS
jgi:RNA recognition motif-containing protein